MFDADVIICGGSLGGVAAALAACGMGKKVVLLEATQWVGGQLTSQAVPPDEHRQIEFQGCTASYRSYRQTVRDYYSSLEGFSAEVKAQKSFCPADSEVSLLSHPPKLALKILSERLQPFVQKGLLAVYTQAKLLSAQAAGDEIASVTYEIAGQRRQFSGRVFLDATDTGELLEKSGTEFTVGAESASATGERDAAAVQDCADLQPCTYTACIENRKRGDFVIPKPYMYDRFKKLQMPYDSYPVYSMYGPDSQTGRAKRFGMFEGERGEKGNELFPLFKYRRIVAAKNFVDGSHPMTSPSSTGRKTTTFWAICLAAITPPKMTKWQSCLRWALSIGCKRRRPAPTAERATAIFALPPSTSAPTTACLWRPTCANPDVYARCTR